MESGHRIEVGQRRQVYDRVSHGRWYVDITDEFLRGRRDDINVNPNLNRFNNGITFEPLHPPQDFVIGDEYVETPKFQLNAFPLDEQVHYGFIMPGLERQHEHMEDDDEHPDPLDGHIRRVMDDNDDDDPDPWAAMWHELQQRRPEAGGRTRRRRKSKGKSKCKSKCKSKKTVKTRKCNRRKRTHK